VIVFDLSCDIEHRFEGWFRNSDEYHQQLESGLLTCPVCGSDQIVKIPSPSRVNLGKAKETMRELANIQNDVQRLTQKLQNFVKQNFEDVGSEFAEEAKKIHYGEAEERNIHGIATSEEITELYEEGVDAIPLFDTKPDKDKLN
jgi:hypothetical protein